MKNILDDALIAKCKALDFSVESENYDKNLEILQGKLANINEERCNMNGIRRIRKPLTILVAVIALMAMSVATFAASPALRNRAIRAVQFDDGTIRVISTHVIDAEQEEGFYTTVRMTVEDAGGVIVVERECGTMEEITPYNAADLCPDDELLGGGLWAGPVIGQIMCQDLQ